MPPTTKSAAKAKGRRIGDASKPPDGERKRPLSAFVCCAHRRAGENAEKTRRQNEKLFAELDKQPVLHLDFEVVDLIREDRDRC